MTSFHHQPSQLKSFYTHIISRLTGLLEAQVRGQLFNHGVVEQAISELNLLETKLNTSAAGSHSADFLHDNANRCAVIANTLSLLEKENQTDWEHNCQRLESLIVDVHDLVERLALTLLDKSLFECNGQVF